MFEQVKIKLQKILAKTYILFKKKEKKKSNKYVRRQ